MFVAKDMPLADNIVKLVYIYKKSLIHKQYYNNYFMLIQVFCVMFIIFLCHYVAMEK